MCCTRLAKNRERKKIVKKSQSARHRTTLSGCIFATKACVDNRNNLINYVRCKIHFSSKSCVIIYWQRYCAALEQWGSTKLRHGIYTRQGGHPVRHWAVELSSYVYYGCLYYGPVVFHFSFFLRLFSAVGDWMSTILPHMMWS